MALDSHLLQSINIAAFFFVTYLLSNFSQTHFVERVIYFVLGNTNTPFPPCFALDIDAKKYSLMNTHLDDICIISSHISYRYPLI